MPRGPQIQDSQIGSFDIGALSLLKRRPATNAMDDLFDSPTLDPIEDERSRKQAFLDEYMALCRKCGFEISARPSWIGTNHGSFELSIIVEVSPFRVE
jgi:hypothetical protein